MGIYDRDYYRKDGPSFLGSLADSGKICKWLIALNVVVFLAQVFSGRSSAALEDAFVLDTNAVLHGQVWRLLTATFLHAGVWHLLWNMLFLWWFGHEIEEIYGRREFLAFYLVAAVVSSLAYVASQLMDGSMGSALGASGAVMAVMVVYAMHYPHQRILLLFIPIPIWLLVGFKVAQDAFVLVGGLPTMTAVAAHLGGAAFGFFYKRGQWRLLNLVPSINLRKSLRSRPRLRIYDEEEAAPPALAPAGTLETDVDEYLEAKLDAVLKKIARTGKESLTESERQILLQASEMYRRRRT